MNAPPAILPVLALVVLGVGFATLTRRVGTLIGRSPTTFETGDTAHDLLGRIYRVGGAILFMFLVARTLWPSADGAFGLIPALARPAVAWTGLVVLVVGAALILAAQAGMGTSWRIGLDGERTALVEAGLFRVTRNPTFLGMILVVGGAFLFAPTALTFGVLVAASIAFSLQVRLEEAHLEAMHGDSYRAYRGRVRRWI